MEKNRIHIKNMVCNRCIMVVKNLFADLGIAVGEITLGEVEIKNSLSAEDSYLLRKKLEALGFEMIDSKQEQTVEQIKSVIIQLVHNNNGQLKTNLSSYISDCLHHDYSYLSNLFSEQEGKTVEQFFIAQKIERVKELLEYDELSLSEIADLLNYSSSAHLSSQFKKVTGLSPSIFKKRGKTERKPLDKV